jgi:hypothetical protein
MLAPISMAHADGIFGFRQGPTYRPMTQADFWCTEIPGSSADQIADAKKACEMQGLKWLGRSNWTPAAKRKQAAIDAARATGVNTN